MRPQFHPRLVNGPFEDPALLVQVLFEKRALLFDVGDVQALAPREVLALSDVFVSHTHMDHFVGLDRVVRICLGRDKRLRVFGPPGIVAQVGHKLAAYTWNLVRGYDSDFTLVVSEFDGARLTSAEYHCRTGFGREDAGSRTLRDGVLLDEDAFRVRCAVLDHKIPCLAFALEEKAHLNVWKNRLDEMGLPVGHWLNELKRAVRHGEPDDRPFRAWWREGDRLREVWLPLGELRSRVIRVVPGQKIGYVVDTACHPDNARRIVELTRGSDLLFIETTFLHEDLEHATAKYHLTARQAGSLARAAGVKRLMPFHFSPKYMGQAQRLTAEALQAFGGDTPGLAADCRQPGPALSAGVR